MSEQLQKEVVAHLKVLHKEIDNFKSDVKQDLDEIKQTVNRVELRQQKMYKMLKDLEGENIKLDVLDYKFHNHSHEVSDGVIGGE